MIPLAITGVGVCATGMRDWTEAQAVLLATVPTVLEVLPRLAPECLPPLERRRANATTRLAVSAAVQAVAGMLPEDVARIATVFSSSDGDGDVLANMLAALAQPQVVLSPTLFHNSVFNAPAGYWSIGAGAHAASITVSAGPASFFAGLSEAHGQVLTTGAPVLYVAFDAPFPVALASFARSAEPFACALLLQPLGAPNVPGHGRIEALTPESAGAGNEDPPERDLRERFSGNAAAAALPLLAAIARRRRASIALPYFDGTRRWLDYVP
jgi:Beta-ketoacyl synthase, N-terminal domain